MVKKTEQEAKLELDAALDTGLPVEETALATTDALDFLVTAFKEEETKSNKPNIPRLYIIQPGKKFSEQFPAGFVIDYDKGERLEGNITQLRVSLLDGPISGRVLWPFDPATGKRLSGTGSNMPVCGSSDGVSPRSGEMFNYIGAKFTDPRSHAEIVIGSSCATCSLKDWSVQLDENNVQLTTVDRFGKTVPLKNPPPCQETPAFVLWDHDRNIPLLFQASNTTVRAYTMGRNAWAGRQPIKGLKSYYEKDVPVIRNSQLHPLLMAIQTVRNDKYNSSVKAPDFRVHDNPLTEEELNAYAKAKSDYKTMQVRDYITGALYNTDVVDDETTEPQTANPF